MGKIDSDTGLLSAEYLKELRGTFGNIAPVHDLELVIKTLVGLNVGQLRQIRDANIWQLSRTAAMALEGGLTKEAISKSLQYAYERDDSFRREVEQLTPQRSRGLRM